jgi:putative tricarboxylic transport membrane protein
MVAGGLLGGFINALSPANLTYAFLGCLLGTIVGVLPGLGPGASAAMLLPLTLYLPPTSAIVMLSGIYYGAMYGGSTTSILLNVPGEDSSVPTAIEGYPMTSQGRAGEALAISAIGSFVAGTFGVIALSFVAPALASFGLRFGPPEYFGLFMLSLTLLVSLSGPSLLKGLIAGLTGVILAAVGYDPLSGIPRLTFGFTEFTRGIDVIPVLMGLFGISEVMISVEGGRTQVATTKLGPLLPRGAELRKGILASMRGTLVGFFLGLLPGLLTPVGTFMAYDVEKRLSKYPERFGTGVIEGVAAPEAANNALAQAGFIPLMALGIPTGPTLAIIYAALILHGLQPGPLLFTLNAEFAWTVIAAMYIGNVMLLILNLPLVALWVRLCLVPYKYLGPTIIAFCFIGSYSFRNSLFDVWLLAVFSLLGYVMRKSGWPTAPLILGFILGPMTEQALRESLQISRGSLLIFTRPITLTLLIAALIMLTLTTWQRRHVKTAV